MHHFLGTGCLAPTAGELIAAAAKVLSDENDAASIATTAQHGRQSVVSSVTPVCAEAAWSREPSRTPLTPAWEVEVGGDCRLMRVNNRLCLQSAMACAKL
eukprot:4254874-Pyramimonas_sp.AAC.1